MKDEEQGKLGQENKAWRQAGAPPKKMKTHKKKGVRPKYANGKDGLREKI